MLLGAGAQLATWKLLLGVDDELSPNMKQCRWRVTEVKMDTENMRKQSPAHSRAVAGLLSPIVRACCSGQLSV